MKKVTILITSIVLVAGLLVTASGEKILPSKIQDGKFVYDKESTQKIKEREKYIKNTIYLCGFAESKFEKTYCYLEAQSILNTSDLQIAINHSKEPLRDHLKKIVSDYKTELKINKKS